MITIEELTQVTSSDLAAINKLLPQLSDSAKLLSYQGLLDITKDIRCTMYVAREGGNIVGMGMILIYRVPSEKRAHFEEIVVDAEHRKHGIGTQIMQTLINRAKKERVTSIYFSSRPDRAAANALYKKLGFEPYETNVYMMKL